MDKFKARPARILLIEDDPSDRKLTSRFLKDSKFKNDLYVVKDGVEALDFLYHRGEFSVPEESPKPDLILLDLNLPRIDGREVLEEMKTDDQLRQIPVVVMTTSEEDEDIHRSYNLGASSYIVKPLGIKEFADVVKAIKRYWFQVVVLPSSED